ncbi:MAG TPA: hypothetical protein VM869_30365 [Enhygromyxa sp.]|nr:hypothetical protein [Enhygromyxa sp.]
MEDLESFEPTDADTRVEMDQQAVLQAVKAGVLDVDEKRARARYSDGQVLGADGFRRDHALFGRRQRDLGRIVERGVVEGLHLRQAFLLDGDGLETDELDPTRFVIEPGHGVTRAGQTIVVREQVEVDLTQLPIFQQLDAVFGLDRRPRPPARTQSGVFAVALRPVEFTANPIAPYPTQITGERRLEDGDVIEASLLTLVPLQSESSLDGVDAGPAALARRVFATGLDPLPIDDALPIAVLALERGQIAWLDVEVARREATADPGHGFGIGHRSELDAHMRHFEQRMNAILERRVADGLGTRFAASDYFEVLPPAGEIPAAAVSVNGDRLVQWFFPADVDADLVLIPEDELPELIEEAMSLGPYDLSQGAKIAEASPMMIAIAIPREDFATTAQAMGGVLRQPIGPRLGSFARRRPIDALLRRFQRPASLLAGPTVPTLVPWESALAGASSLFYLRQRRRARTSFALARYGPIPIEQRPSGTLSILIRDRIDAAGELARFDQLLAEAGAEALERLEALFSLALFADPLFVNGVMAELSSRTRRRLLEPGMVTAGGASISIAGVPAGAPAPLRVRPLTFEEVDAIAQRYESPSELGDGMALLVAFEPELTTLESRLVIAQSLRLPELDRRIRETPVEGHEALAAKLLTLAQTNDVNGIRDLVGYIRAEPPPLEVPRDGDGLPSTGFEHANAMGQGALFALLWNEGDEPVREALDKMLEHPAARQQLVATVLMMRLLRLAWSVNLEGPQDVWLLLEHLYRWPFTPETKFRLPTLSAKPVWLEASNPQLIVHLQLMSTAGNQLTQGMPPGLDLSQATALLEAQGFPPDGLEAVDAYRIIGCALNDLSPASTTGGIEHFFAAEFPAYVAALSEAVLAADVEAIKAVNKEWSDKL